LVPKSVANATVDRLLHDAHVMLTNGDTIRLRRPIAARG
jgi:hypothetical protein